MLDDWTNNLDQGKQIYTDIYLYILILKKHLKAFDKVPHHGLLCKLKEYHLDHRLLYWITNFLCNRKQGKSKWVLFSMVSSREWHSTREYPGPNIILDIYINDLPSVCRTQCPNTKIFLYADDAKVYNV